MAMDLKDFTEKRVEHNMKCLRMFPSFQELLTNNVYIIDLELWAAGSKENVQVKQLVLSH